MVKIERKSQLPKLSGNVSALSTLFAFCTSNYVQRLERQGRFFSFNANEVKQVRWLRKKNVGKPSKPLDFVIENLINKNKCQKANKFLWGCFLCCWFSAFSFVVCGCGFGSSVSLVRRGFLVVAVLPVVLAVLLVCRSVGVAFLSLLFLPFVGRGSFGLSVLPLSVVVRVSSCGCGCGFVLPAPTEQITY